MRPPTLKIFKFLIDSVAFVSTSNPCLTFQYTVTLRDKAEKEKQPEQDSGRVPVMCVCSCSHDFRVLSRPATADKKLRWPTGLQSVHYNSWDSSSRKVKSFPLNKSLREQKRGAGMVWYGNWCDFKVFSISLRLLSLKSVEKGNFHKN